LEYSQDSEKSPTLHNLGLSQTLPDAPRIRLDHPSSIISYCLTDLETPEMDKLDQKLWWAGPTPAIVSLTQQTVLDRRIQLTEDPSVHLLWVEGIVYLKPLPAYLASSAFWEWLCDESNTNVSSEERARLKATSLGFLKTYASLIQRRSDFIIAQKSGLLASFSTITFEQFVEFISVFETIPSLAVSPRWRYGLIQLDALNFHSAIHLRRWHLNRFESRYGTYFSRFFPTVLFIFALFSVMLSAMQVIIAAKQMWETDNKGLRKTLGIFVWFGTEAIGWSMGFGVTFVVWWVGIATNEVVGRRRVERGVRRKLREEGVGA
jgi:hypothetical protein